MKKGYWFNVLLCIDLLGSAFTGGIVGETLSGRAGSAQLQGKWRGKFFAAIINFLADNPNHCVDAIKNDKLRAETVIADYSRN